MTPSIQDVRKVIPLKQGLRPFLIRCLVDLSKLCQKSDSIKTRIETLTIDNSDVERESSQKSDSIKTRIETIRHGQTPHHVSNRVRKVIPLKQGLRPMYQLQHSRILHVCQKSDSIKTRIETIFRPEVTISVGYRQKSDSIKTRIETVTENLLVNL